MQVWVNTDSSENVGKLAADLEKEMDKHADKEMKAFVVWTNTSIASDDAMSAKLQKIAKEYKLSKVALTYLNKEAQVSLGDYQINTAKEIKNTVFVYKSKRVKVKFVNLKANEKGLTSLNSAISDVTK